jgi:hypothetical protein
MSSHVPLSQATPDRTTVGQIYFPTVESCWDYGIARNAPLLPFIGSLLPYNFLRGVQFDTKVFKISEFLAASLLNIKNLITGTNARNEVILKLPSGYAEKLKALNKGITYPMTDVNGNTTYVTQDVQVIDEQILKLADMVDGLSIHIAMDNDSDIGLKISNEWKVGDDLITRLIQGGSEILKNINENYRTLQALADKDGLAIIPFQQARYSGTTFDSVTINFTLFTRNNYIRDIYLPLKLLKLLCLPNVSQNAALIADYQKQAADATALAVGNVVKNAAALFVGQQLANASAETTSKVVGNALNSPRVVNPPPVFQVEHNGGLFFMKGGVIKNFSYKPEGPWVRAEYDGLFGKVFPSQSIASILDRLLQDVYVKFVQYPELCYPTRIKCSMTLQEIQFITAEDHLKRDYDKIFGKIKTAVVNTLDTGTTVGALVAGGIAQNLDILIPDTKGAGDLLSGGKWVPPGESISGIPGFL